MSSSNINIIIYISLWAITFFYYWKKKNVFGAGNLILGSYLAYSILSYFLYNNFYTHEFGEMHLFPFIYLYVMMLVALQPVLKYDEQSIIFQPSRYLINALAIAYVITGLVALPVILSEVTEGIIVIFTTDTGGDELYQAARLEGERDREFSLYNIFKIIFNFFNDFGVLLFFYYSTLTKKNKFLLIGMGVAIFISLLESLSQGLRTTITMKLFLIVSTYFLFRKKLPNKQKRVIDFTGGACVALMLFYIITVNISRFSNREYDSSYQLLNYAGQANLFFNEYGLDAGGIRYGDRTMALFKKWLQFENVPEDFIECRSKYGRMKLDDSRFSTFIGDFTLDFGPIATVFIICSFSLFAVMITRKKGNRFLFHHLILVFFVMEVCVQGGMYLFNFSFSNNLRIVYLFLYYLLFKWDYDTKMNNRKLQNKEYNGSKK